MLKPKKNSGRIICASLVLLLVIASLSIASASENEIITISGKVYLPDGTTPANATEVAVMNIRTEDLDTTYTDEDGYYSLSIPALQDDMLKFAATRGFEYDKHTIEASEVTSPYDITLDIQKPGTSPTPVEPLDIPEDDPFMIDIPTVKEVQEATKNGTDVIEVPHYNVTVSNLLIKDGVAVYNQREWVQIYLKNIGDIKAFKVTVDVSVIEEGQERPLKYLHYGALQPGMEKERKVRWTPQVKEDCTIVLDIEYMENHPVKGDKVNYTEDIGVAVADEEPVQPPHNSPWEINGHVVMKDWYLELGEDIIITSTGWLQLMGGTELIMKCQDNGEFSITVEDGGRFDIWGDSELKSSTSWNNFRFHNYGRLDVNRSTVKWTYGNNKTLSDPGGIQCFSTSTTTIRNSTIKEGYTHNIYAKDCSPLITNSNVTFAGTAPEGGYGIYATGNSQPEIMHSNISDNKVHGVHFENIQNPVSPPWPPEMIQASSYNFPVIGYTNITDTPVGIYVKDSDLVGIGYGNITLGRFGVYVENSDVYFLDANVTKMRGEQLEGFGCIASDSSIFLNSTEMSYNNWGVAVDNSEVTIENNSRILYNKIFIGHGDGISGGTKGLGVSVDQFSNLGVKDSLLAGSLNNLVVRGGSTASIHDNMIGDVTITAEGMQPYNTRCIVATDAEIEVKDNEFYGSHRQLLLNGITSSSVIESNYFDELRFQTGEPHRSFYGIELIDSYPRIIWNEISNYSTAGVYCRDNSNPEISNNTIYSYGGSNSGIYVDQSSPSVKYNDITENDLGIWTENSQLDIKKNNVSYCEIAGIYTLDSTTIIEENNIFNNTQHGIYLDQSENEILLNDLYNNSEWSLASLTSEIDVHHNFIHNNTHGIYCEDSPGTADEQIADNTISGQIDVKAGFIWLNGYGLPYIEAKGYGVYLKNSPLSVTGNHILYNAYGVVSNNSDASVDDNLIEKHLYGTVVYDPSSGSFVTVATGFGVYVFEESNPTITNNQIDTNHRAIIFDSITGSGSVNEIVGNSFTSGETLGTTIPVDPHIGIHIISSSDVNIVDNEIDNHSTAITIEDSSHVTVELNDIDNGRTGLSVRDSDFVTVRYNNIDRFGRYGIYLSRSTPSITWNNVTNNGVGIFCYDIPSTPNVFENNIFGNTQYGIENQASNPEVDAQYNWWGHSRGSYHPTNYPGGQGDEVSDNVNADNWKTNIVVWW